MAFSRAHLYNEQDQITSHFAKALSHPARLSILRKLNIDGPCNVMTLIKMHPISQAAISQHLSILRKAHLVDSREIFPYTIYKLNKKNFNKLKRYMKNYLESF